MCNRKVNTHILQDPIIEKANLNETNSKFHYEANNKNLIKSKEAICEYQYNGNENRYRKNKEHIIINSFSNPFPIPRAQDNLNNIKISENAGNIKTNEMDQENNSSGRQIINNNFEEHNFMFEGTNQGYEYKGLNNETHAINNNEDKALSKTTRLKSCFLRKNNQKKHVKFIDEL